MGDGATARRATKSTMMATASWATTMMTTTMAMRRVTARWDTATTTMDDIIGAMGMENEMIEGTIDKGAV